MGALFILRAIILGLSLLLALSLVWILPVWQGTPLPLGVTIASLVPLFTLLAGIHRTVFQVNYKMHYVFIVEVAQRILTVSLIAFIVGSGIRETYDVSVYYAFLGAGGVGAMLLFVLSMFFAYRQLPMRFAWNAPLLKRLLLQAAPYGAAFFCTALYRQMDVTLIALLRSDYELQNAYYGFALRAVEMGYLFPTFLLNSTLPILNKRHAEGQDTSPLIGKIFFAIALLGTTMLLFALLWARPLMLLLTTDTYLSTATHAGADTALQLLALPMLLNGFVLFSFYSLLTTHSWRPLVGTLFLGALLSIGLNIVLIPRFGFVGACAASIVSNAFLAIVLLPQSLRMLPMHLDRTMMGQWALYAGLLGGVLLLVRPLLTSNLSTVIGLAGAGIVIIAISLVLKLHRVLKVA